MPAPANKTIEPSRKASTSSLGASNDVLCLHRSQGISGSWRSHSNRMILFVVDSLIVQKSSCSLSLYVGLYATRRRLGAIARGWLALEPYPHPPKPAVHSPHPSFVRTRAADRLLLGAGDAAPGEGAVRMGMQSPGKTAPWVTEQPRGSLSPALGGVIQGPAMRVCRRLAFRTRARTERCVISGDRGLQYRRGTKGWRSHFDVPCGAPEGCPVSINRMAADWCPAVPSGL